MLLCDVCGNALPDQAGFCPYCGNAIAPPDAVQPDSKDPEEENKQPKLCTKCGAELPDEVSFCPVCGNPTVLPEDAPPKERKSRKKWIVVAAVAAALAILAITLFSRPNMKLKDFGEISTFGAILKFGIPSQIKDDGSLVYDNCIKVYGYVTERFIVDPEKDEYLFNVYDGRKNVQQAIADAATSRSYDILGNRTYSFKNLDITDYDWAIEIVVN